MEEKDIKRRKIERTFSESDWFEYECNKTGNKYWHSKTYKVSSWIKPNEFNYEDIIEKELQTKNVFSEIKARFETNTEKAMFQEHLQAVTAAKTKLEDIVSKESKGPIQRKFIETAQELMIQGYQSFTFKMICEYGNFKVKPNYIHNKHPTWFIKVPENNEWILSEKLMPRKYLKILKDEKMKESSFIKMTYRVPEKIIYHMFNQTNKQKFDLEIETYASNHIESFAIHLYSLFQYATSYNINLIVENNIVYALTFVEDNIRKTKYFERCYELFENTIKNLPLTKSNINKIHYKQHNGILIYENEKGIPYNKLLKINYLTFNFIKDIVYHMKYYNNKIYLQGKSNIINIRESKMIDEKEFHDFYKRCK